ncbi:MAG: GyrI-like domain-containing protein [Firmicutes bacterium]|nr:GyrI-like domain-containing protein [Bacillota bacterium]
MEGIRVLELPRSRMATSGNRSLEEFNTWWSEVDKARKDRFFPRDFMWFDAESGRLVWYYALPPDAADPEDFDVVDFPGGLYAVAVSRDEDDADGERVYAEIKRWVEDSRVFAVDEGPRRHTMFHVVTPDEAYLAMGFRQLDIFVPIRVL